MERAKALDAGKETIITQLIRRGETVERIAEICRVSPAIVEGILEKLVAAASF